ncbi:MAG: DUF5709 domain-containing protein [Actinomycetes bacterium]
MSENDNVSETVGVPPDDAADDLLERATGEDVDSVLDEGYSPPEKPLGIDRFGTTLEEERQGESLDQRLAQEEPEVPVEATDAGGARGIRAPQEADWSDLGEADGLDDGELLDDQVGDRRAGRLVEYDEGAHTDSEKDAVALDVGIDGGAASAEEAAMHIVDETDRP